MCATFFFFAFQNVLMGTFVIACGLELGVVYLCHRADLKLAPMPAGPWVVTNVYILETVPKCCQNCLYNVFPVCRFGAVFAAFIPYFCDVPRVAITHLMGIPVTGKSLTYIIGLQVECLFALLTLTLTSDDLPKARYCCRKLGHFNIHVRVVFCLQLVGSVECNLLAICGLVSSWLNSCCCFSSVSSKGVLLRGFLLSLWGFLLGRVSSEGISSERVSS